MENQRALTVSILGKKYSLLTDETNEIVEQAAQLISNALQQIESSQTTSTDMVKKTTFVALKIAVDLIKERKALQGMHDKTTALNNLLRNSV